MRIRDIFERKIDRNIEEVIKVDQTNEDLVRQELEEYVVTDSLRSQYADVLERYDHTFNSPHERVGIWVSGFFGSGKSSFAKNLGLALENRPIQGRGAADLLADRIGENRARVLLHQIGERLPTEAVIFDVSTDRGIRSGGQMLTEIMYRLFLRSLGYAGDLDLAELEIQLEADGRLGAFEETYQAKTGKGWDDGKGRVAFALQEASAVMHALDPDLFPTSESWREAAQNRSDITPGLLAQRCKELMERRRPGRSLVFVVDEVGQFVARDVQKMLDLQAIVQSLGRVGRGSMWLVVTSQERLTDLVGGLDDRRVELARLMDRFPVQVHLEQSDISEVTGKRVLAKTAMADQALRGLFQASRGRLEGNTRVSADIRLPGLDTDRFVELYPLLPYHVDLIISIVSGLRTQAGASRHVGGANRTIIKLAQQVIVHPEVGLGEEPLGALVRMDQLYDLVSSNIPSELRGTIEAIPRQVDHPLAQPVAKAVCLLQYVQSVHRTKENIAAVLHPSLEADSCLPEVSEALEALVEAGRLRLGQDGYRIPSETEDVWERARAQLSPHPGDVTRLQTEVLSDLWTPQPSHVLLETRTFKAGLQVGGRTVVEGDVPFHVMLVEPGGDLEEAQIDARARSQVERGAVFWVAALNEAADRATRELWRSQEMLTRRERQARTGEEAKLVDEEKRRRLRHQEDLKRLTRGALLSGAAYFRGNERSPEETARDAGTAASRILGTVLPEVFHRFREGAARVGRQDLDRLLAAENLRGLPRVFTELGLLHEEGGLPTFRIDHGPLSEVLARIQNRAAYGDSATGRYLTEEFGREPFGWEFDVVRLFVASLLRAGCIEVTSRGQIIDSATSVAAKNTLPQNNHFKQATFRPKEGPRPDVVIDACEHFQEVYGRAIPEIEPGVAARTIRTAVEETGDRIEEALRPLLAHSLPGTDALQEAQDQIRALRAAADDARVLTLFNASYRSIQEADQRAREVTGALHGPALEELRQAREALTHLWPALREEADGNGEFSEPAEALSNALAKPTFYRELPEIGRLSRLLSDAHQHRWEAADLARREAYHDALRALASTPGWEALTSEQQTEVGRPLRERTVEGREIDSIRLLRESLSACPGLLNQARERVLQLTTTEKLVRIPVVSFFAGGIESEEQLDQALKGLRDACARELGQGHRIFLV